MHVRLHYLHYCIRLREGGTVMVYGVEGRGQPDAMQVRLTIDQIEHILARARMTA